MRIVLLYAPPWKIARNGDPLYPPEEGPPDNADPAAVTEGDFIQAPYGLLSLAAQALRSGLSVQTVNASNFTWPDIEILIRRLNADLFGLSCMPEMHLLHVDLCRAYLQEGNSDAAERHLRRAIELGFFLPGIVHNLYACIAAETDAGGWI